MEGLFIGFTAITWKKLLMMAVGGVLIYLAIKKEYEPALLLPIGFGTILVNIPFSSVLDQVEGGQQIAGALSIFFRAGILTEIFPLLIFVAIGAMIDFSPLFRKPILLLFGAAAQFGIFFTMMAATLLGFDLKEAAAIGIIGSADGPTSIYVASRFARNLIGPDLGGGLLLHGAGAHHPAAGDQAADNKTRAPDPHGRQPEEDLADHPDPFPHPGHDPDRHVRPHRRGPDRLPDVRQPGARVRRAEKALARRPERAGQPGHPAARHHHRLDHDRGPFSAGLHPVHHRLGLCAFIFDTAGGVLFAKFLNLFLKRKVNPMIGAAGISAFPMSARVIHTMGRKEDSSNFLLMYAVSANVSGQIGSVLAGGLILALVK